MKAGLITQGQIQNGGLSWLRCTFAPIILALIREYHSTAFLIIRKGDYHYFLPTSAPPTTHHHLHSHPHRPFPHTTPNPTTTPSLSILHSKRPALLPIPTPPKTTPHSPPHYYYLLPPHLHTHNPPFYASPHLPHPPYPHNNTT